LKYGIIPVLILLALVNAMMATLMGINIPLPHRIVYNLGQQLTGGVVMLLLMRNAMQRRGP
jgi:hypothetical protein